MARLDWICETLKEIKDRVITKKKKNEKTNFKEEQKKKVKFEVQRD